MLKKTAAILAVVFAAVLLLTTAVFADGPGSCTVVQTSYADKDGNFTVEIRLSNNPGIRNMSCNIRYDYQHLQFVSAEDAGLLGGFYYSTPGGSIVSLTWMGNGKDIEDNGRLATLTFKAIDTPEDGSIIYNTVSAHAGNGISVQVDGVTAVVFFGTNRNSTVPQNPQNPNNDPATSQPVPDDNADETENLDDEMDETEQLPDETTAPTTKAPEPTTTPPTTTAAPTTATTRKTTTEATTSKTTTTTTEATTTEPTTTPEPETTPEVTTEPTTTSEPETEPTALEEEVTTTTEDEPTFADIYEAPVNNKSANRGTILIALMAIALTVVVVIAIEMYKRGR